MVTMNDIARDLRAAASRLELVEQDLPAPDACAVVIALPEAVDVFQAGETLDTAVFASMGATTARSFVGVVELRFSNGEPTS